MKYTRLIYGAYKETIEFPDCELPPDWDELDNDERVEYLDTNSEGAGYGYMETVDDAESWEEVE